MSEESTLEDDPLWYKDAIIYELHVKAFCDSAGDGIGDFKGLTSKLDYLKDLGVTAVWLLPFYPSPLKDDGYDISDYYNVHTLYGALKDFKGFLSEAHSRGIRVITELVLNHTSDQHPWFIQSRRSEPGSKFREFYVWNPSPDGYKEARIIFKDFETSNWTYDPVAKSYFWHRFYSHQPDLNYDNPEVQNAMLDAVRFWLKMGVDGLRLDAVPYLFEREGTNCENLPETHGFLKKLRATTDAEFKNKMFLAEANQWPADAAAYFGNGDECHMAYHFPLMPRMFMAIQMEDNFPIIDILEETPNPPENCQHALFLRNHDELTLEMVTDEERDYMYRVYARDKQARINLGIRRRLAPLLGDDRRKIELMNVMLFTLPGTPVIYYGDEIGMGDNFYLGDRNGVRTPMQWSADMNAGFSRTNPQKLYLPIIIEPLYHYEVINVENQQNDPTSLMWWMKRLIAIRKRYKAFGRGTIQFIFSENPKILSFIREYKDELILVMLNLSKNAQSADFDFSKYNEYSLQDVFGGIPFPKVSQSKYRMTFGAYGYYVFAMTAPQTKPQEKKQDMFEVRLKKRAQELFSGKPKEKLESEILPTYIKKCRWFGGKGRVMDRLRIRDVLELQDTNSSPINDRYNIMIIDVYYTEGLPDAYLLPLEYLPLESSTGVIENKPNALVSRISFEKGGGGILFDAVYDPEFCKAFLGMILNKQAEKENRPGLEGDSREGLSKLVETKFLSSAKVRLFEAEQSNSSAVFDEQIILKVFRKIEEGINPEVEISDVLAKHSFTSTPSLLGELKYKVPDSESTTLGILQTYVRNQGDGWKLFTSEFQSFMERVTSGREPDSSNFATQKTVLDLALEDLLDSMNQILTPLFVEKVRLLGQRTAEFHRALFEEKINPDFAPEPLGYLKQAGISQSMVSYANRVFKVMAKSSFLQGEERQAIESVIFNQDLITKKFTSIKNHKIDAVLMRTHGDYHLGQVLYTGKDFSIIDYEGEPSRPLTDRRLKRSALRDVAGMIRSFHYVVYSTILGGSTVKDDLAKKEAWADIWYKYVSATFLRSYLNALSGLPIAPKDKLALGVLLDAYLLEKVVYELWYEFNNRPQWILIPIRGIRDILGQEYHLPLVK
ncbi:MAG TPA: maltose alpha-D-glucosyltransferase [Nitrososphaerales archaeon]|nr:maltose alpha-D-glucosyltransferase [Nitrososphaerales archaeon]